MAEEDDFQDDKNEDNYSISFSPQQSHIFGGENLFLSFVKCDKPLSDDMVYSVVFDGSKCRHITSTKIVNPHTLQAIIPDHNEAELVKLSVWQQSSSNKDGVPSIIAEDTFVFTSDSSQFLTQELAMNALNPLALLQLQHVYSSLLDIPPEEKKELDAKLTASFRHLSLPAGWTIARENINENEESNWTLLHFCAKYNLSILADYFLHQPGANIALRFLDKHGRTAYDIAAKKNNKTMMEILTRLPCETIVNNNIGEESEPDNKNTNDVIEQRPSVKRHRIGTTTITSPQNNNKTELVKDLMLLQELDTLAAASKGSHLDTSSFSSFEESSPLAESLKKLQEINDEIRRLRSISYKENFDQYDNDSDDVDDIDGEAISITSFDGRQRDSFIEVSASESICSETSKEEQQNDSLTETYNGDSQQINSEKHLQAKIDENIDSPLTSLNNEEQAIDTLEEAKIIDEQEEIQTENKTPNNETSEIPPEQTNGDVTPNKSLSVERRTVSVELQSVDEPQTEIVEIVPSSYETFSPEVAEVSIEQPIEVHNDTDAAIDAEENGTSVNEFNFKLESVTEETEEELKAARFGRSPGLRNIKTDGLVSSTQTRSLNDIPPAQPKIVGILKRTGAKKDRPLSDSFENLKMVEKQGIVGFFPPEDENLDKGKLSRGLSLDALTNESNEASAKDGSQTSLNHDSQESLSSDEGSPKSVSRTDSDKFSIGSYQRASSLMSLNDIHMSRCSSTSSQEDFDRFSVKRSSLLNRLTRSKKAKSMTSLEMVGKVDDDKDDRRKTISGELEAAFMSGHMKLDKRKSEEEKEITENKYGDIVVRCESYVGSGNLQKHKSVSTDRLSNRASENRINTRSRRISTPVFYSEEKNELMEQISMANKSSQVRKSSTEKKDNTSVTSKKSDSDKKSIMHLLRTGGKPKEKKLSKERPKEKKDSRDRKDSDTKTKKVTKIPTKQELPQSIQKNFLPKRGASFRHTPKTASDAKSANNIGFTKDLTNKLRSSDRRSPTMNRKISSAIIEHSEANHDSDFSIGLPLSKNLSSSQASLDSLNNLNADDTDYSSAIPDPSLHDSSGHDSDLDAKDEKETWSELVDKNTKKKMHAKDIKRQDVIYELIQTEALYVRTLHIMKKIYAQGMLGTLQMSPEQVNLIFPHLDDLIELNGGFLKAMKERQESSPHFCIEDIGDILLEFFGDDTGENLKYVYGQFCSRHLEAVQLYKECLKADKRFAAFMKRCLLNDRVRRLSIPECITYVTIRMTKYPLLIEAIIKATKESKPDYDRLKRSLKLVKEVLHAVDDAVELYEQEKELKQIKRSIDKRFIVELKVDLNNLNNTNTGNSATNSKKSNIFRPSRLFHRTSRLLLDKKIILRGKNKSYDIRMVVLNTKVIFFQENGGKLQLFSVDNKAPVLMLKNILVKEVATDEKALFLVSTSKEAAQIYELVCESRSNRSDLAKKLQGYVKNSPDIEEDNTSDEEEAEREELERLARLKDVMSQLQLADDKISEALKEKNKLVTEMRELIENIDENGPIKGSACSDLKPAEVTNAREVLDNCLNEVNELSSTLSVYFTDQNLSSPLPSPANFTTQNSQPVVSQSKRAETFSGYERLKPSHSLSNVNRSSSLNPKHSRTSVASDVSDSSKSSRRQNQILSVLGRTKTMGSSEDLSSTLSSSTSTSSLASVASVSIQMQLFQSLKDNLASLMGVTNKQDLEIGKMRVELQQAKKEIVRLTTERKEIDEKMTVTTKEAERQIRHEKEQYQKLYREFKRTTEKLNKQYMDLLSSHSEKNSSGQNGNVRKQKHDELFL